jgi:hypothetical protein
MTASATNEPTRETFSRNLRARARRNETEGETARTCDGPGAPFVEARMFRFARLLAPVLLLSLASACGAVGADDTEAAGLETAFDR